MERPEAYPAPHPTTIRYPTSRLAARLAAFYAASPPVRDQGAREVVRANVEEDFDQVQPFVGRCVESATFEAVRAWQLGFLEHNVEVFEARREALSSQVHAVRSTLPALGEVHARKEKRT
jgi:aminoglycoside phosphotransferase family enzyme